jgi:hypothetical protein
MSNLSSATMSLPEAPFLQNPQGWKFFLRSQEVEPGLWRGLVHIHTGATAPTMRLRCTDSRATEGEALDDAKTFAELAFIRIAVRFSCIPALKHRSLVVG